MSLGKISNADHLRSGYKELTLSLAVIGVGILALSIGTLLLAQAPLAVWGKAMTWSGAMGGGILLCSVIPGVLWYRAAKQAKKEILS